MNSIFEGRLVVARNKDDIIPLIIEELEVIPSKLLKFVFEKGFRIYVPAPGDKLFFIKQTDRLGEGRRLTVENLLKR